MAKQVTDEEASLKRQARRRLIGAVALVTAAAVILPMVMDSEPKPSGIDIELRIPDKNKVEVFRPQETAAPVAEVAEVEVPPAVPVSAVAETSVAEEIRPVAPPPAPEARGEPRHEAKPRPEPKHETRAEAEPKAKSAEKGALVWQIGAYANADIARDWQAKLKKQGFHAYTESAGGRTRLRVGPFSNRDAADRARRKLEALGLHPDLVEDGKHP
jgi:DedD protein